MNKRLPLASLLTIAAINSGILQLPYQPRKSVPWEPPPEQYPYAGPPVAHVETKGRSKGTRRSRKAGSR